MSLKRQRVCSQGNALAGALGSYGWQEAGAWYDVAKRLSESVAGPNPADRGPGEIAGRFLADFDDDRALWLS